MDDEKDIAQRQFKESIKLCPPGIYRHYRGGLYVVYDHTLDETTLLPLVHYRSVEKGTRWTRTLSNFTEIVDGRRRFEVEKRFKLDRQPWSDEALVSAQVLVAEFTPEERVALSAFWGQEWVTPSLPEDRAIYNTLVTKGALKRLPTTLVYVLTKLGERVRNQEEKT